MQGVLTGLAVSMLAVTAGCSSSSSSDTSGSIKGQRITVLIPYKVPQSILADFTKQTGVNVSFQVTAFDALHQKLVVAASAQTNIADVTEMDWSWVGQFGGSGWYSPLEKLLPTSVVSDLGAPNKIFTSKGHLYAACYSNDMRFPIYNGAQFTQAGITTFPTTFAELAQTLDTLKAKHVTQYPMTMALGATEGGITPWYLLTLSMGGQLFDADNKPVFGAAGSIAHKALEFEINAVKQGWLPPGAVTTDDGPAADKFTGGAASIALTSGPGSLVTANDKTQSKIAPNAKAALMPGVTGAGPTLGLPEGLGIPSTSKHKAAAAAFIKWWQSTPTQIQLYKQAGFLPCSGAALAALTKSGELQGGPIVAQAVTHVTPLFQNGAPPWYAAFSSKAQGLINSAVKGDISVDSALSQLSDATKQIASR
jgi:multiple sugar transport system substrate-binding protein